MKKIADDDTEQQGWCVFMTLRSIHMIELCVNLGGENTAPPPSNLCVEKMYSSPAPPPLMPSVWSS